MDAYRTAGSMVYRRKLRPVRICSSTWACRSRPVSGLISPSGANRLFEFPRVHQNSLGHRRALVGSPNQAAGRAIGAPIVPGRSGPQTPEPRRPRSCRHRYRRQTHDIIFKRGNSVERRLVMGENTAGLAFGFFGLSTKHTTIEAIMPTPAGPARKYLPAAVAAAWRHYGTVAFDVEIFHDHRQIVDRHAIIRDQAGDLTR